MMTDKEIEQTVIFIKMALLIFNEYIDDTYSKQFLGYTLTAERLTGVIKINLYDKIKEVKDATLSQSDAT